MQTNKPLAGVFPIVHTPFTDNDVIDEASLRRQLDWAFDIGADGCGTGMVSEILRLTTRERTLLAHLIPEIVAGRGTVFASVGAESTAQAIIYAREAESAGNDALMAIPPTLTDLPKQAYLDYFSALAEATRAALVALLNAGTAKAAKIPIIAITIINSISVKPLSFFISFRIILFYSLYLS